MNGKRKLKALLAAILAVQMMLAGSSAVLAQNSVQNSTAGNAVYADHQASWVTFVSADKIQKITADKAAPAGYEPEEAVDGNPATIWHSPWSNAQTEGFPHTLTLEFTEAQEIDTLAYTPRQGLGNPDNPVQFITDYEIWVSPDDESHFALVSEKEKWRMGDGRTRVTTQFPKTTAKLVKFVMKAQDSNAAQKFCTSVAELEFGLTGETPPPESDISEVTSLSATGCSTGAKGYEKEKAVDKNASTFWHNEWNPQAAMPHWIEVDLGSQRNLLEVQIMPRQDQIGGSKPMAITGYNLYGKTSADAPYQKIVHNGKLDVPKAGKYASIKLPKGIPARFVKIESIWDNGGANSAIAEIKIFETKQAASAEWLSLLDGVNCVKELCSSVSVGTEVEQYPQAAYDVLLDAVYQAELVLNQPDAANQKLAEAATALTEALKTFESQMNFYSRTQLAEKIAKASELKNTTASDAGPTVEQREKFTREIQAAQAVYDSSASSEREVHTACKQLDLAYESFYNKIHRSEISLEGRWGFQLGAYNGLAVVSSDSVKLPGTMDENKKGTLNTDATDKTRLSPRYKYAGKAVYQKIVTVPDNWSEKRIVLKLERTRFTKVWVNGQLVGSSDALGMAQYFDLTGKIRTDGENVITVEVDNASYPGEVWKSHMVVEETQGNWNGIVGEVSLTTQDMAYIDDMRVYPNDTLDGAVVKLDLGKTASTGEMVKGVVSISAKSRNSKNPEHVVPEKTYKVTLDTNTKVVELAYPMGEDVLLWDEFDPALYDMTVRFVSEDGSTIDEKQETFGMRKIEADNDHFIVNGNTVFLRGEANCAVFPLTAYPPMDKQEWVRILSVAKDYGLNHYRLHSWCPPQAAFDAADELGIYMQPELYAFSGDPFGDGTSANYKLVADESRRIFKEYANSASFVTFTFGNEMWPNAQTAAALTRELKATDSTRLYSETSNNYSKGSYAEEDEFWIRMGAPKGEVRGGFLFNEASTRLNYSAALDGIDIPFVSHEIGQYQNYPDFDQIEKYTGVFEARNLEIAKRTLTEKGMLDLNKDFALASNELTVLCYRAEIESALRTGNLGGYELLGLQDFPGQGSAMVGLVDNFMESKSGIDPDEFKRFNSPVTALSLMDKYIWTNNETFAAQIQIANYGNADVADAVPVWNIKALDGTVIEEGECAPATVSQGDVTTIGEISASLTSISEAQKVILEIGLKDGSILSNTYELWVYPAEIDTSVPDDVLVARSYNDAVQNRLDEGGKVLILPKMTAGSLPNSIGGQFSPHFWSAIWFVNPELPSTHGMLIRDEHPVFENFPTESYTNWQWWDLVRSSRPINLDATDKEYRPIVHAIDNFGKSRSIDADENRKLGILFEGNVGDNGGRLMVCSMDLIDKNKNRPEAKQLLSSILGYMGSDKFAPKQALEADLLKDLMPATNDGIAVNTTEEGFPRPIASYSLENLGHSRLWKTVDGDVNHTIANNAWTNWDAKPRPGDWLGVDFGKPVTTGEISLYFYEDHGCKAPSTLQVQYWNGTEWADVANQSVSVFAGGKNAIAFDLVTTTKIRADMTGQAGMGIAVSEFQVFGSFLAAPDYSVKFGTIGEISGAKDTPFNVNVSLADFPEGEYKAIQSVVDIPKGVTVTGVEFANLNGGTSDFHQDANGKLRISYLSTTETPIEVSRPESGEIPVFTIQMKSADAVSEGTELTVTMEQFLAIHSETDKMVAFGLSEATATAVVKNPAVIAASARELYRSDGGDLIVTGTKAVAVEFINMDTTAKQITFGETQLWFSDEMTKKSGKATYLMMVSADTPLENLNDYSLYTVGESVACSIVFGDTNANGEINAEDALAILSTWLRKTEVTTDEQRLVMNVSADGSIDTSDAIAIVDRYISGTEFAILRK